MLARVVGLGRQIVFAHTVGERLPRHGLRDRQPAAEHHLRHRPRRRADQPSWCRSWRGPPSGPAPTRPPPGEVSQISLGAADLDRRAFWCRPAWPSRLGAGPLVSLLIPLSRHRAARRRTLVAVSSRMLVVFAPQILLYGLAVVLYGILQAHRRFTAPALAPVLSSLVVIAAYLAFVPARCGAHHRPGRAVQGRRADAVGGHHGGCRRAGGDRAGAGLAAATPAAPGAAVPRRRRAPRPRPGRRSGSPRWSRRTRRSWWSPGSPTGTAASGAVVLYSYGWQVFTSAYAVLAIPIAISAFPALRRQPGQRVRSTPRPARPARYC